MPTKATRATVRPPRVGRQPFGIPIGRIAGIPIVVSLSWLLSVLIIAFLATPVVQQSIPGIGVTPAVLVGIGLGVLLGVSVLAHELGHCLAAKSMGVPVRQVRLYLLGGVSELGRLPGSPREEAVIAAAGPGVSLLLAGISGLLIGSTEPHTVSWLLLVELALANLVVALFNILPALPLDGGRVLRAGVWQASGRRRYGTVAAVGCGYLIAAALLAWGVIELTASTRTGVLQGGIAVVMALFVGWGAAGERHADRAVSWPGDVTLAGLAASVVQLPAESPVGLVLQVAAGRAVVLTGVDGVAVGLLDQPAAVELARTLPDSPAEVVARRIGPDMIVLADDQPAELAERARTAAAEHFLLVDDSGRPVGVVPAADIARILGRRPRG